MKTRRFQLSEFMSNIYIPVSKTEDYHKIMKIIGENDYRSIQIEDSGKTFLDCLVIETKGRGKYETFQGYSIARIDIGEVTENMADIAIYPNDGTTVKPLKVKRGNIKINLPE